MSADTVHQAIINWLAPPAVTGLNSLDAPPWFLDGSAFKLDSTLHWGAMGFVWLDHEAEHRIAMGGNPGGLKQVTYNAGIKLVMQYMIPRDLDVTRHATDYRTCMNQLTDGIKTRLRQGRTLGTSTGGVDIPAEGAIIMAGEGDGSGSPDIEIDRDLPRKDNDGRRVWSFILVRFMVVEVVPT